MSAYTGFSLGGIMHAISRRNLLQLGGAGLVGLTLPKLLAADVDNRRANRTVRAKNVIFIWQQGGPPHQDMWDMKPLASSDTRSEFSPISTTIPGYTVCELMPKLSQLVQHMTILRGVNHHIPDHNPGSMFMLGSGNPPNPTIFHPTWSAVVKRESETLPGIPTSVAIPSEPSEGPGAGFLGAAYQSFATQADPNDRDFRVRALAMPRDIDLSRIERRRQLLDDTNRAFDVLTERPDVLRGFDRFHQEAHAIIQSPTTRRAFDVEQESATMRDRYGRTKLGQRLMLARRLVESGVRFVTISEPTGWDTHEGNFRRLRENLPVVDQGVSALIEDLRDRGMLQDTLVMMFGEFGRTPKINVQAGRDHWPQAMSIVLAGGGAPAGLIYGTTDRNGAYVTDRSHSPADFACTIYNLLGIDPHKYYPAGNGQPTPIVRDGEPIRAVIG
ncbi:MAG: DUF1501 domain-containing protein [Gemmataceae bacterium]|nr:DUF1501 domain-containing protein [Gemmataceae bacterium]